MKCFEHRGNPQAGNRLKLWRNIAQPLERRVAFRRVMEALSLPTAMRPGRAGSASPARAGWAARKSRAWNGTAKAACPLQHLARADIDYGVATAFTTYVTCGVKVWIFKGEIMDLIPLPPRSVRPANTQAPIVRRAIVKRAHTAGGVK